MPSLREVFTADDRSFVTGSGGALRTRAWLLATPTSFSVAGVVAHGLPWDAQGVAKRLVLAAGAVVVAFAGTRRAHAYRDGWIDGRTDLQRAFGEARARGLTDEEWIRAQKEADLHVE